MESPHEVPDGRLRSAGARGRGGSCGGAAPWLLSLAWAVAMFPLTFWGLPDRSRDELLFGGEPPWPPERYRAAEALAAREQRAGGADTDVDPLAHRGQILDLTATEADRAAILRRYRLYSRQPDEMITLMALQRMKPGAADFDPRLFQYGGGYVYLIGAALAGAKLIGAITLTSDVGVYLESPELFGHFYVVGRCVALTFGALALVAVYRLARRAAGAPAGFLAMLLTACCPVFITAALEMKPHLPSACMLLWAIMSALDYHERGRRQDALKMGLQVGYALALVLTGMLGLVLWPVLLLARRPRSDEAMARRSDAPLRAGDETRRRRGESSTVRDLAIAGLTAIGVYLLTNPYVPYDALFRREVFASNLGNSIAMYVGQISRAGQGAARVGELLVESCGWGILITGGVSFAALALRRRRESLIVASVGGAMIVMGVLLGAGKPAEFARFLLLPALLLCVAAAIGAARVGRETRRFPVALVLVITMLVTTRFYVYIDAFAADARDSSESRRLAAMNLATHMRPSDSIAVIQEPAPYAVPPIDFARRRVVVLPPVRPPELDAALLPEWLVLTSDDSREHAGAWWRDYYTAQHVWTGDFGPARICWASKPAYIYRRTPSGRP